jgi:UDP-N-acetylmuramate--alanine ligase
MTYGLSAQADVSAHGIRYDQNFGSAFTVWRSGESVGEINLRVPGLHNVYNALAAIAVGFELEVPFSQIAEALASFTGAGRRFQFRGEAAGVLVVDDYGHHPTEIKATLAAAKIGSGGRHIVVLFQPHRYSRTNDLMEEFARSFNNADTLFVTDIYAASEEPIEGVTAETLTNAIKRFGHKDVRYVGPLENAAEMLRDQVQAGDLVITLGAGTVNRVSEQLLTLLRERSEATSG